MNISSANSKSTDNTKDINQATLQQSPEENDCLSSCEGTFKDLLKPKDKLETDASGSLLGAISKEGLLAFDIASLRTDFNYDTFSMDKDDAMFFVDMVNNDQFALNLKGDVNASLMQLSSAEGTAATYKSANVSKTLMNLIENSMQTNKPVRIDFDNNVSVVLKVDKSGKISADFIPGDKAVEQYLRDNIGFLKQKFDDQNLSYSNLSYRQYKQDKQKKQNKGE